MRLASVCKHWRRVAAQATAPLLQELRPLGGLQPVYLSKLLAELVPSHCFVHLSWPLAAASSVHVFLRRARTRELKVSGPYGPQDLNLANAAAVLDLSEHAAVLHLTCGDVNPVAFPPRLQTLCIDLRFSYGVQQEISSLLQRLDGSPRLTQLTLVLPGPELLPRAMPSLPTLKSLCIHTNFWDHFEFSTTPCLLALQPLAAQGVHISLDVNIGADDREPLWSALAVAQLPSLDLELADHDSVFERIEATPAEPALLARVRCTQLLLGGSLGAPLAGEMVACIQAETVLWRQLCLYEAVLDWAWLAARPGCFVLEVEHPDLTVPYYQRPCSVTVTGCPLTPPAFAQPWALVLHPAPPANSVRGLPLVRCLPGPDGSLVWCNSAASDQFVAAALDQLPTYN